MAKLISITTPEQVAQERHAALVRDVKGQISALIEAKAATTTRRALTDKYIQSIKPTDRRATYWDSTEPGLGVVVQPSGYKSFVVIKRIRGGKPVKYVIRPEYPVMTLALAREKAAAVKRDLAAGINTRQQERQQDEERERQKSEEVRISFAAVAEQYIAKKLVGLRCAGLIEQIIRRDVLSRPWARKSITAVSKADVVLMIHDIVTDKKRTTPGQWSTPAERAYNQTRKILAWGLTKDFGLENNVADRIDIAEELGAEKRGARERVLEDHEIRAFWRVTGKENYPGGAMLRLLFMSACRLREIAHCEWSEFSTIDGVEALSGPVLIIPAARMKGRNGKVTEHVVPIVTAMQAILDAVPKFAGNPRFVFSQKGGRTPFSAFANLKNRVDALMREALPELPHWQFHDLRRTARSLMSRAGISADIAERVLAHRLGGIRGTYDRHQFLAEKRDALQRLAALVGRILANVDNVSPIRKDAASA
jgi:integrase